MAALLIVFTASFPLYPSGTCCIIQGGTTWQWRKCDPRRRWRGTVPWTQLMTRRLSGSLVNLGCTLRSPCLTSQLHRILQPLTSIPSCLFYTL
ncbi:hypothetical protein MJO29_000449 [Puccinia striiformis f. sp. tritici]|nr:hypothetical protein MJO29_000449 [Puccinia striiformis f. sp. tritici]